MLTIRAVGNNHAETRATPVLTEVTGRRVEFDYGGPLDMHESSPLTGRSLCCL